MICLPFLMPWKRVLGDMTPLAAFCDLVLYYNVRRVVDF